MRLHSDLPKAMTEHKPPARPPSKPDGRPPATGRPVAVIALAMAAVPCCPLVSLAGGMLGLLTWGRMRRRGHGGPAASLAKAAAITGLAVSIISTWVMASMSERLNQASQEQAVTAVQTFVSSAMDGRLGPAQATWINDGAAPDLAAINAFGAVLLDRYGRLKRCAILTTQPSLSWSAPRMDFGVVLEFERRDLAGMASFGIDQRKGWSLFPYALRKLTIEDHQTGDMVIPDDGSNTAATQSQSSDSDQAD